MKERKKNKIHVRNGDMVQIISGTHKNKVGTVIKVMPKAGKVVIKNLNLKTKHIRAKKQEESGRIISFEAPIHSSNVMLYSVNKKTCSRYSFILEGSKKYRQLNKTREIVK